MHELIIKEYSGYHILSSVSPVPRCRLLWRSWGWRWNANLFQPECWRLPSIREHWQVCRNFTLPPVTVHSNNLFSQQTLTKEPKKINSKVSIYTILQPEYQQAHGKARDNMANHYTSAKSLTLHTQIIYIKMNRKKTGAQAGPAKNGTGWNNKLRRTADSSAKQKQK